jgi:hypothetical protein
MGTRRQDPSQSNLRPADCSLLIGDDKEGDVPSFVEIGEAVAAIDDTTRL